MRLVDQEQINEFGKLNNRLLEIRADITQWKTDSEKLDDATAEMMMSTDGKFMLLIGESFVEVDEEYATECKSVFSSLGIYERFHHLYLCFNSEQTARRRLRYVYLIHFLLADDRNLTMLTFVCRTCKPR